MDSSVESLLDAYLFETNSLLMDLDGLLINAEKSESLSQDDVNEIFLATCDSNNNLSIYTKNNLQNFQDFFD